MLEALANGSPPILSTPSAARIVDSRKRIVLQSGPKMSSKDVTRIDAGSVVKVLSGEGKWGHLQTDGLVDYVRRTGLEAIE